MALLEVRDLTVTIGTAEILSGVSFTLDKGDRLGFVGESGCGKSMTALAIMGLLPDAAEIGGSVRFDGQELTRLDDRQLRRIRGNRIGMVFQEPMTALNPVKTIGFQVAEGMRLHLNLSRAEIEQRTRRLLDRVGLPAPRFSPDLYPHQLSGGQRQRVVIAAALACDPEILLADEPSTALDVTIQAQILDLIADVVAERQMALIMITHDLGVVAQTTRRMMVMYAGSVVERGPTVQVFKAMAHPYTRGLFDALPGRASHQAPRTRLSAIPGMVPDPRHRPSGCTFADRCGRADASCRECPPPQHQVSAEHDALCFHPLVTAEPNP